MFLFSFRERPYGRGFFAAMWLLLALTAGAANYYVDATNGKDTYDGTSATVESDTVGPKKTIQAAVDLADGETKTVITVAPGVYDEGGRDSATHTYLDGSTQKSYETGASRVVIDKKYVELVSSEGQEKTFIVGRHGTSTSGLGTDAVRCVYVWRDNAARIDDARDVVIRGFTICNGATRSGGWGGGVGAATPDAGGAALLIDCVVSNCVATRGGGLFRQNAYRTRIDRCTGVQDGSAMCYGKAESCVFTRNTGVNVLQNMTLLQHCTIALNGCQAIGNGYAVNIYNSLSFGNGTENGGGSSSYVRAYDSVFENPATFTGRSCETKNIVTDAAGPFILSTAFLDVRLLSSCAAVGKGRGDNVMLSRLVLLPEGETHTDFAGTELAKSGDVTCGAYITPVTPAGGRVSFRDKMYVEGFEGVADVGTYHYPEGGCTVPLKIRGATSSRVYAYKWTTPNDVNDTGVFAPPSPDGWMRVSAPLAADAERSVALQVAFLTLYVDHESGDDGNDGSAGHPYKTLQKAADRAKEFNDYTVVYVAPGTYDDANENGHSEDGYFVYSRLHIKNKVGFIATEGPEKTIILGAPDPDTKSVGPKAVRCVYPSNFSYVQGFTLANGYSADCQKAPGRGGAIYMVNASSSCLADCIVSNNHAVMNGAVRGGHCYRCLFVDNHSTSSGQAVCGQTGFISCAFANNRCDWGNSSVFDACWLFGCTVDQRLADTGVANGSSRFYGCAVQKLPTDPFVPGNDSFGNVVADNLYFRETDAFDFRPTVASPMMGAMTVEAFGNADIGLSARVASDIASRPLYVCDGKVTAGAAQDEPCSVLTVEAVGGGMTVAGAALGTHAVTEPATVVVTATEVETRPFVGFEVNGELLPYSGNSYSFDVAPYPAAAFSVRAVYGTTWYVDQNSGDDGRIGGSPAQAFKTIFAATQKAVAGDAIRVGPGTYGEDETPYVHTVPCDPDTKTAITIGSRVRVPGGVTLESSEGPSETFIVGKDGAESTGCGEGALRCAFLGSGATIRGFTLTGGRVGSGTAGHDDNLGAGVLSYGCTVIGCVISNCVAGRTAAFYKGQAVDCAILGNTGLQRQSVGRESSFLRCVIAHNRSKEQPIQYATRIEGCTFFDNTYLGGGELSQVLNCSGKFNNNLVRGPVGSGFSQAVRNCAFETGKQPEGCVDCVIVAPERLALDESGRPVVGSNDAIDAGNAAILDADLDPLHDQSGFQRVMNGRLDIGALEADWRPRYARDIGNRVTVTGVSPAVFENDARHVFLPSGELAFTLRAHRTSGVRQVFSFDVTGTGTLRVFRDGSEIGTFVRTGDVQVLDFVLETPTADFRLVYEPGEDDDGGAEIIRLKADIGLSFIVR